MDMINKTYADRIIHLFVFITLLFFPLYYHNKYADLIQAKYSFFYMTSILMLVAVAMIWLYRFRTTGDKSATSTKAWKTHDYSLMMFWGIALISTLQSDYRYEAFWGNEGRYIGLFLISILVLDFFVISRLWSFNPRVLDAFLIAGMAVCLIGIADFCGIDILGIKENMDVHRWHSYTSTFGNINSYTLYVALVTAVSFGLYVFRDGKGIRNILYYFCMFVSMIALFMGRSDNAYLSLGALFLFSPLVILRRRTWIGRYALALAALLSSVMLVDWIGDTLTRIAPPMDGMFLLLSGFSYLPLVVVGMLAMGIICLRRGIEETQEENVSGKVRVRIWSAFLVVLALLIAFALCDCNLFGNVQRYGSLARYLTFDDEWGSGRGTAWRLALEYYRELPFHRKLVGYGPETFGILMLNHNMELVQSTGTIFDNAHNEYLQYLVTMGIGGLLSYLVFVGMVLKRLVTLTVQKPSALAMAFAIICYLAQAVVNINQPITSPFLWIFLALGIALSNQIERDCKINCVLS